MIIIAMYYAMKGVKDVRVNQGQNFCNVECDWRVVAIRNIHLALSIPFYNAVEVRKAWIQGRIQGRIQGAIQKSMRTFVDLAFGLWDFQGILS